MSKKRRKDNSPKNVPSIFNWKMVRKALNAAEEGVYCWNLLSGEIFYTEQCLRMMGLPYHVWAPNIFTEPEKTIHEDDRQFFQNEVQKYIARPTSSPLRLEIRLLNQKSRAWRWIRVNGLLEHDSETATVQLVGVWVDITRRKMADMHAMEDRDLFRNLINLLPDNIYYKNRESRFVMANEATARKMHVPTPSDLIGCKDTHFFSNDTTKVARHEELEIMRTGIPITNRMHQERWIDGTLSWCRLSKFPWYDSRGRVKGIVGISSDITELMQTREKYRQTAEQLESEINLAREIQIALQPSRVPSRKWMDPVTGVQRVAELHNIYLPCAGVAGDFFVVFPIGDSKLGMMICDVMGHGIHSALVASMIRGLAEQFTNLANTPGLLLASLNLQLNRILTQANLDMFATACYVYLDLETRRLKFSAAGHPAPIVLSADGKANLPPTPRSLALGFQKGASYRESEIALEPGMKILLYTDGLYEARNAQDEEIGKQRIMSFLEEHNPKNIREMIDNTLAAMNQYVGAAGQNDDICLLGVEFIEKKPAPSSS